MTLSDVPTVTPNIKAFRYTKGAKTMKTKTISSLQQGDKFTVAGREYVLLDHLDAGAFAIESKSFDDVRFGSNNNYSKSDIAEYLNGDYTEELIDNGLPNGALVVHDLDLKATDGSREYGTYRCAVGLLTIEQYTKYNEFIPLDPDSAWWLATPWGTPHSRSPFTNYATYAWLVSTNGTYNYYYCTSAYGVRPALVFSSSLLVSVESNDEEKAELSGYGKFLSLIKECTDLDLHLAVHAISEELLERTGTLRNDNDEDDIEDEEQE
jgi:hypothetical protein